MNENDLETQPLLAPDNEIDGTEVVLPKTSRFEKITSKKVSLVLTTLSVTLFAILKLVARFLPSNEIMQESIIEIADVDIVNVHLDGWTDGKDLSNEEGKLLQISAKVNLTLDYDKWSSGNSTSKLSKFQKSLFRNTGSNIIRSLCIDVNNMTTFDGNEDMEIWLGSVSLKDPICLSLRDGQINELDIVIYLEPNMKNILKVLKKFWRKDYDSLNLWSDVSVNLSKRASHLLNINIPIVTLDGLRINWKQIINWETLSPYLSDLRHRLETVQLKDFKMTDSSEGFQVKFETQFENFMNNLTILSLPESSKIPSLTWSVKLPDCQDEFSIKLDNVFSKNKPFSIKDNMSISIQSDLEGSFPNALLSKVCWSDEENIVTPMTKLLGKIMNESEPLTVEMKGEISKEDKDMDLLFPYYIINSIMEELSYFPVTTNFSIHTENLIESFTIEDLKIKWINVPLGKQRLSVIGTVTGLLNIPFYETTNQRISVNNIKGNIFFIS